MRIVLIGHYFPPDVHGGTQSYLEALAEALVARGNDILVVVGSSSFSAGGGLDVEERRGYSVLRLARDPVTERLSGDMGSERLLAEVVDSVRAFAPDLVHLHHWHALARGMVTALSAIGIPVLTTLHDLFVSCPRHHRMPDARRFCSKEVTLADCAACIAPDLGGMPEEAIEAGLAVRRDAFAADLAASTRVLSVSGAQRGLIRSLPGFGDASIEVMPIGTPPIDAVAPPVIDPGRLRIVNWAGLDPRKGTHVLVRAVTLTSEPEAFSLSLHGRDGEAAYMDELREIGAGLDMHFGGEFEDADRAGFAASADICVLPFLAFETYALTVDEALHLGMPVIVSDRGAPPERVGGRGIVVPADDPEALASVLDELRLAPKTLAEMRAAGCGARFLDEHFAQLFALYREIAA